MPCSVRQVLLCDLDDTLFDHYGATRAALAQLRAREPRLACWTIDELDRRHRQLLEAFHLDVLGGRLSLEDARLQRFQRLLADACGEDDEPGAAAAARDYRETYEQSWSPLPGAADLLRLVKDAGVTIVIVTNNHVAEQEQKLERIGLASYVDVLVASEETGCCKPEPAIFECALARAEASVHVAVMLGDAWAADIEGARRAGIGAVWLNRFGAASPDPSIPELQTLDPAAEAFGLLRQVWLLRRRSA